MINSRIGQKEVIIPTKTEVICRLAMCQEVVEGSNKVKILNNLQM